MTINERIIAALNYSDPVKHNVYTGAATTYFTFSYNSIGADFADDAPGHERYLVQVHFVCPLTHDCVKQRTEIKQKLFAAGFTWPVVENASDDDGQHYIFECQDAEGVELDG